MKETTETTNQSISSSEKGEVDVSNKVLAKEELKLARDRYRYKARRAMAFSKNITSGDGDSRTIVDPRIVDELPTKWAIAGNFIVNLVIFALMLLQVVVIGCGLYCLYYFFPTFDSENTILWSIMSYVLYFLVTIHIVIFLTVFTVSVIYSFIKVIKENGFIALVALLLAFGIFGLVVGLLGLGLYYLIK